MSIFMRIPALLKALRAGKDKLNGEREKLAEVAAKLEQIQPVVEQFVLSSRQARLTKASLETLAIVAYKQPVTRHQVSAIRGVNSDGVLRALVDRGLVEEAGREETPGRPVLFGTTPGFLERLGLPSLASLPSLAPLLGAVADDAEAATESPAGPSVAPDGDEDPGVVADPTSDDSV